MINQFVKKNNTNFFKSGDMIALVKEVQEQIE